MKLNKDLSVAWWDQSDDMSGIDKDISLGSVFDDKANGGLEEFGRSILRSVSAVRDLGQEERALLAIDFDEFPKLVVAQ